MPIFTQGENYDEVDVEEEEEVKDKEIVEEKEEADEGKPKKKPPKKKKQSKQASMKMAAIGIGATVLIVGVGIFAMSMESARREAQAEQEAQDNFDRVNQMFEAGKKDPAQFQEPEEEALPEVVASTTFTDKELTALRKWGYTASEIELASRNGLSAKELVASARADREEAQKEALAAVSDTASDEYKYLLDKTWLGQEELDISKFTSDIMYNQMTYTDNADFEKIEPRGRQCFIKVYLSDGSVAFMDVTPSRYNELPDSGNIVVEVYYVDVEGTWVITSITEKRVS